MKEFFIASICREVILGAVLLSMMMDGITFKTGKATVSPRLRNLEMKYRNIRGFSQKWVLCFPVFSITMNNGEINLFTWLSNIRHD